MRPIHYYYCCTTREITRTPPGENFVIIADFLENGRREIKKQTASDASMERRRRNHLPKAAPFSSCASPPKARFGEDWL